VLLGAGDLELDYTHYTEKVDMWSAGLILAEMAAGGPLFVVDSEIDLLFSIFRILGTPNESMWEGVSDLPCSIEGFPNWEAKSNITDIFGVLGPDGCDLLSKMLTYDSRKRLSAIDALRHPFFAANSLHFAVPQIDVVPLAMRKHLTQSQCVIWATLRKREAGIPKLGDFMAKYDSEDKVTVNMRSILVDWLNEISYSWFMRAERRALHSAVNYLDRYFDAVEVSKNKLQLVGATCYALAAKLEEAEVISAAGYVSISDGAFTEEDMRDCEPAVAHALQCRVALPTVADFEPLIAETLALQGGNDVWADSPVVLLAQMLSDVMLLGYNVGEHQWLPSVVCCSAFTIASLSIARKIPTAILCASETESIIKCIQHMYKVIGAVKDKNLTHTFSNPKYARVTDTTLINVEACISELQNETSAN